MIGVISDILPSLWLDFKQGVLFGEIFVIIFNFWLIVGLNSKVCSNWWTFWCWEPVFKCNNISRFFVQVIINSSENIYLLVLDLFHILMHRENIPILIITSDIFRSFIEDRMILKIFVEKEVNLLNYFFIPFKDLYFDIRSVVIYQLQLLLRKSLSNFSCWSDHLSKSFIYSEPGLFILED